MQFWLFLSIAIFDLISLAIFFVVDRKTVHVLNGHVLILGAQNRKIIKTHKIFIIRVLYGMSVFLLSIFSYFIFIGYFQ